MISRPEETAFRRRIEVFGRLGIDRWEAIAERRDRDLMWDEAVSDRPEQLLLLLEGMESCLGGKPPLERG